MTAEAFFELKGEIVSLFESFGVSLWFDEVPESVDEYSGGGRLLHPFQRSQIKIGDALIGVMGSLHPAVAKEYKLKGRAALAEFSFKKIKELISR